MRRALLAAAAFALAWADAGAAPSPRSKPRTVLLVVFDTTRLDEIGAFGGPAGVTPAWDALARVGTAYDAAFAPDSFTFPSHATMFTGRLTGTDYLLPEGALTERLRSGGFRTLGISANWILDPSTRFDRGFDLFSNVVDPRTRDEIARGAVDAERRRERATGRRVAETAARALDSVPKDAPLFLFVNLLDPHDPYTPEPPARRRFARNAPAASGHLRGPDGTLTAFLRAAPALPARERETLRRLYRAEVAQADEAFGTLLEKVRATRGGGEILVVAVADHGERLGEENEWTHNLGLSEEEVHVPLVVAGPGVARGRREARPVGLAALGPAIERWANDGAWSPSMEPPLLFHHAYRGNEVAGDPLTERDVSGIVVGDLRLTRGRGACRLFGRAAPYWRERPCDPDVAPAAGLVADMNEGFRARVGLARIRAWIERPPSPEWIRQLRLLGYLAP